MSSIRTVAVAGATGLLGVPLVHQFLEDGFKVTVLTRKQASVNFPSSVTVAEVDYDSPETLVKALQGQDAVVSVLGIPGLHQQIPLINAAVKAGVKRFIPSEFSGVPENAKTAELPLFDTKALVRAAIKKAAESSNITYTLIGAGPFVDLLLKFGLLLLDAKSKSVTLWNGGDYRFSVTTVPTTVKAVSAVLKHLEETKNRTVLINSAVTTQNELLERAKKAFGADGWKVQVKSTDEVLKEAYEAVEKGVDPGPGFVIRSIWTEGYASFTSKPDNDLLGIHELTDAELQEMVDNCISK